MLYELIVIIVALAILIKASDFFVEAAAKIARYLNVSEFVIGLTIVAVGTSLPELATSIGAAITNNTGLILGNIIGSNIANVGLILGLSITFYTITVKKEIFNREGKFLFFISFLFFVLSLNKVFGRIEGIIFLIFLAGYVIRISGLTPLKRILHFGSFLRESYNFEGFLSLKVYLKVFRDGIDYPSYKKLAKEKVPIEPSGKSISLIKREVIFDTLKQLFIVLISGATIFFSVRYLIPAASNLAKQLGISGTIVGLTILAIGTSLPELVVGLTAIKKAHGNLLLGTIVGSNVSNLLLIIGVSSIITPLKFSTIELYYYVPAMICITFLFLIFVRRGWELKRIQGIILLILYILFIMSLGIFLF